MMMTMLKVKVWIIISIKRIASKVFINQYEGKVKYVFLWAEEGTSLK